MAYSAACAASFSLAPIVASHLASPAVASRVATPTAHPAAFNLQA